MEFEWSEAKRLIVLQTRGIDFVRLANDLFDGRRVLTILSSRDGEERFVTLGSSGGKLFAIVWTQRGPDTRIITARRARDGEERRYRASFGG